LSLLEAHPGSRLTELKLDMFRQGLPDSWPILVDPPAMANYHHLGLCQDPERPGQFVYRLNVVHSALRGEVWLNRSTARSLQDWIWDSDKNSRVWAVPVITVAKLQLEEDRHSMPMMTKLSSFRDVIGRLALLQEQGRVRVVVSRRGAYKDLAAVDGSVGFHASSAQIGSAHGVVAGMLKRCEGALGAVESPWPTPLLAVAEELEEAPALEAQWRAEVVEEVERMRPEPSSEGRRGAEQREGEDQREGAEQSAAGAQEKLECVLEAARRATSTEQMAKLYVKWISPQLEAVKKHDSEGRTASLKIAGGFFNFWLNRNLQVGVAAADSVKTIVAALRAQWFEGTAREGPSWESIE
jgi:hypothetical protein